MTTGTLPQFETYTTRDGDMVDEIAFSRFGRTAGVVELILEANPGLAARGPRLPAGLVICLPLPVVPDRAQATRLWS